MRYWPWLAAGAAVAYTARGRRVPRGCNVSIEDEMVFDDLDGPEGTYRSVARCGGREVGQIQVEVSTDPPATPRCGRNAAAQRRKHRLRSPGMARTSWAGLDAAQRRTGLGTKMYEVARDRAHALGVPLVPDACGFDAYGDPGETSDAAWRVWQSKLGWKGRTNRGRRAEGGIVTWPTFRKRRKASLDDYKRRYPDAQVEFDTRSAREQYNAKVENTKLALETARAVQALLRKHLQAVQPNAEVKIVGGLALGTFFDKAPRAEYDLDFLIEGFDPMLYDLRGRPLVYGREHVGSDLGYAARDAGNLISKRNKLPGHGKATLDLFLLDPNSGLLWVYEGGWLRRAEKGEFGKNKVRDRYGFARGSLMSWDDFQRQFLRDARKGLRGRRTTRKSLIEAAQGICTPGNYLNCQLFTQLLIDTPRLYDLPVVGRERVGDVLQYGSNPARHWAVYIGNDEVLHVPEWGGALEIASWDAVEREHGPPIIRQGRRATQTCTAGRTDPALWAKVKKEVTAGSKGGKPGQWSARKAQMAVQKYKARGGTYCGPKTKAQKSLTRWTKEEWGSDRKGDRYLPKKAREALTDAEYRRTSAKKRRDTAKGKQFSKQPRDIAKKTAKYRDK